MLTSCGCQPASPPDISATFEEPVTWQSQISALRDETITEVRHTAPLTQAEAEMLLSDCDSLAVLEADFSQLDNTSLGDVLQALPKLRQLKLYDPIDNERLATIAANAPLITVLNLSDGKFNNEGFKEIPKFHSLQLLRFSSPNVEDPALTILQDCKELKYLHLINVPITNDGLKAIESLQNLQSFYLDGGNCTEDGLSQLIKARPDLHFHWNQLHLEHDPHAHAH